MDKKKLVILGSTGSVGTQTLDIIGDQDRFKVVALACYSQIDKMIQQAEKFKPQLLVVFDESLEKDLFEASRHLEVEVASGMQGLIKAATLESADVVLTSVVGNIGLLPTVRAIEAGKDIALANKETLVTAGSLIMSLAKKNKVKILPVDSEHSAIFQCLQGENTNEIDEILLTASGGAFRNETKASIRDLPASAALKHPNWSMGQKITIDSATLMNKGLELIEAKWLFDVEPSQIKVLVHPQSVIHSMVRFKDQSVMAQLGNPDMRLPIIYALDYPKRYPNQLAPLQFDEMMTLTFDSPDLDRFPCLKIAIEAINKGGIMPTIMNAANEVLVYAYLENKIKFYDISDYITLIMDKFENIFEPTLEDILSVDQEVRRLTNQLVKEKGLS